MSLADVESSLDGGVVPVVRLDAVVVVAPGFGFVLHGRRIRSVFLSGVRYERVRVGGFAFHVADPFGGPSHVFLGQAVMVCKRAFDQRVDAALEPVGVALHGPFPKKRRVAEREQPPLSEQSFQPPIAAADIAVGPPPFLPGRLRVGRVVPSVGAFLQEPLPLAVPVVQCAAPRRRLAGVPHLRRCVGEPLEFLPCLQPGP